MRIQHNISALNTHRNLASNNAQTAKALEKLSSGYKINRAGDDAAGLAISEKMRGQIRGLDMASKNAQDGISLIQTAEGALNETHSILQRMRELAVQAGNDTNTTGDREEIQKEINQLTSEINRIGNTTEFNTKKLVNGELSEKSKVAGSDAVKEITIQANEKAYTIGDNPVSWSAGGKPVTGSGAVVTFSGKASNDLDWAALKSGATNEMTIKKDDSGKMLVSLSATDISGHKISLSDETMTADASGNYSFNMDGAKFSLTKDQVANWENGATATIKLALDATDVVNNPPYDLSSTSIALGAVAGGVSGALTYVDQFEVGTSGASGTFPKNVDEVKLSFASGKVTVELLNGGDSVHKASYSVDNASGDATFGYNQNGLKFEFGVGEGVTSVAATSIKLDTTVTEEKIVKEAVAESETDASIKFQIGANKNQAISVSLEDMRASALGITTSGSNEKFGVTDGTNSTIKEQALDITDHGKAAKAIEILDAAITKVSAERSKLGAVQNRLDHTINNLGTSSENLTAAESRIRDTDMAASMMNFTKNNILTQAAQSMLAQANQQPQGVLQLLG